jgi:hypothetical protein
VGGGGWEEGEEGDKGDLDWSRVTASLTPRGTEMIGVLVEGSPRGCEDRTATGVKFGTYSKIDKLPHKFNGNWLARFSTVSVTSGSMRITENCKGDKVGAIARR